MAQTTRPTAPESPGRYQAWVPPELRDVGIDEKSGDVIPPDLSFVDETGKRVRLGDYFDGTKPVVLQLGYFNCPQLCGQVTQGMVESLKQLTLDMGRDFLSLIHI